MNKSQLLVLTILTTIILFIPIYLIADFDNIGKAIFPLGIFFFFVWPWIVDFWFYINNKLLAADISDEVLPKNNNVAVQDNSPIQNSIPIQNNVSRQSSSPTRKQQNITNNKVTASKKEAAENNMHRRLEL